MVWVPMQLGTQKLLWRSAPRLQEGGPAGRTLLKTITSAKEASGPWLQAGSRLVGFAWQKRAGADSHSGTNSHSPQVHPPAASLPSPRSSASSLTFCWFGRAGQALPIPRTSPCPSAVQGWLLLLILFREAVPDHPLNPHPAVLYCLLDSLTLAAQTAWLK